MAFCLMKSLSTAALRSTTTSPKLVGTKSTLHVQNVLYSTKRVKKQEMINEHEITAAPHEYEVPILDIGRPISDILKELNKKVPDSLIKTRTEANGFTFRHLPWHIVNRIMNLHAPEWSGEVRSIICSADGKYVSVTYRVTIYGNDAELYRESTGTAAINDVGYGDPVQKAEAMAFRRACARFGLGLHLYHEEL